MVSIAVIVLGIGFAVVFGWMLVTGISRALGEAIDTASAVAEGDLTRSITTSGSDEVAQLLKALAHMQDGLRRVVGTVRQGLRAQLLARRRGQARVRRKASGRRRRFRATAPAPRHG